MKRSRTEESLVIEESDGAWEIKEPASAAGELEKVKESEKTKILGRRGATRIRKTAPAAGELRGTEKLDEAVWPEKTWKPRM